MQILRLIDKISKYRCSPGKYGRHSAPFYKFLKLMIVCKEPNYEQQTPKGQRKYE